MLRGTFSTSRATTGPIFGHFMAPIDPKQPYLALSSFSSPKWVEYWLNMIEHCISHPRGSVRALSAPRNCQFWAPDQPKNVFFSLKLPDLVIDSPSSPKWVKYWVNMVEHCISHPGGSVRGSGPFRPPENVNLGPQNRPKCVFRPKMAIFSHKQPKRAILGGSRAPQ